MMKRTAGDIMDDVAVFISEEQRTWAETYEFFKLVCWPNMTPASRNLLFAKILMELQNKGRIKMKETMLIHSLGERAK